MDIARLTGILRERKLSLADAANDIEKKHIFEQILKIIIKPKSQADRTAFRNLSSWIITKINDGTYQSNSIYKIIVDFALEASGPNSRNPAAVFTSILKKELHYLN